MQKVISQKNMIKVENLSKIFSNGKGIFDVSFTVSEGEVFGFIGPNGAGKSTTIRHLMGFLKPNDGYAHIKGLDCWHDAKDINKYIGYLPGEIVFPSSFTAREFIGLQEDLKGCRNFSRSKEIIERFELDINVPIKKMSKGMKQKLAIVATFMNDPQIIILDEPSAGLDPIMQRNLIDLFKEEKQKGKTIFLSSHIFEEIETVVDTICIVKNGKIVEYQKYEDIKNKINPILIITLNDINDISKINIPYKKIAENCLAIEIEDNADDIIKMLSNVSIHEIDVKKVSLADIFEKYYKGAKV